MFAITRIRTAFVAVMAMFLHSPLLASGQGPVTHTRTTELAQSAARDAVETPPAGSPEFGVLIIIAVVAFFIFVAWLVVRVGDDPPHGGDGSII
jgi:hypothetical protein